MNGNTKHRDSNLELYRIILMLLIVAHHYVVNSGIMEAALADGFHKKSIFLLIFGSWGKISINCFILITGFFMCKSQITIKKFTKLLFEILFYNSIIYLLFASFNYVNFSLEGFLLSSNPIKGITNDFSSCFLVFYLLIPFLNIVIKNVTKNKHLLLIMILLTFYSIFSMLSYAIITFNYVTWFCVIYIIGAYIRLYGIKIPRPRLAWPIIAITSIAISIVSVIICFYQSTKYGNQLPYYFIMDSNKPLAVIVSISLFMTFKNLRIKYNPIINTIASSVFGVLLIHANSDIMRYWLWHDTLNNATIFYDGTAYLYAHAIASTVIIFITCVVIDQFRIKFLEKPFLKRINPLLERLENKLKDKLAT